MKSNINQALEESIPVLGLPVEFAEQWDAFDELVDGCAQWVDEQLRVEVR